MEVGEVGLIKGGQENLPKTVKFELKYEIYIYIYDKKGRMRE